MNAATLARDPFAPKPPKGRGPALGLALAAHVVLLLALAFGVNWRASQPPTLAAELWSAVPQAAAPRAVEPPPPEPKRPEPVVKATPPVAPPKPEPQALPDPQIAIEKAKREEAKRARAEQEEKQEAKREKAEKEKLRSKDEAAQKKALAEKQKLEKQKVELAKAERAEQAEKADAARENAIRDQNLKRLQGLAGATGGPTDTGTALRSSGPSESYAGRIVARIKPNIVFTDPVDGNPVATVEVKLAPDGTIIGKRLLKGSGVKAWDDAVLRAIDRTEVLPRDTDGRVPPPFPISFRMRD